MTSRRRFGPRLLRSCLALTLPAAACMVGPDYERPSPPLNDGWLDDAKAAAPARAEAAADWWTTFHDPALAAIVTSVRCHNLSLRVAGLRVLEARARLGIAVGEFFPQLQQGFAGASSTWPSENGLLPVTDTAYSEASIGVQATWELDFWGKYRRAIRSGDAELLASVADYDAVLVTITAEAATDYVLIRSLEERLVQARANVALQQETLRLTESRFKAGAVSELDVATASGTLANTQALIPEFERALRQAKLALGVLLGRTPSELEGELAPAAGEARRVPEAPAQIALGVPADLVRRRPDVRAAERIAAAQCEQIGIAKSDLFPSVSLLGSTGFAASNVHRAGDPSLDDLFSADSFTGFVGLHVNLPILNYGRIENGVRVQDARFEEAVAAWQESVLRAAAEVEAGLAAFLHSRERSDFLEKSVRSAQRAVALSLIQYRNGAVDFIRVNDAQSVLVTRQDAWIGAQADVALGAIETYRALGGGWEIRADAEFVDPETLQRMRERTDWGDLIAAPVAKRTENADAAAN